MAGGSTSEEMDALDPFDDVTPDKPVSIYDLDEDLPTRAQSSEEIAEYQRLLREKREAAFRSFKPPKDVARRDSQPEPSSTSSVRPVPRESGPVRIDRMRVPPPGGAEGEAPPDLDEVLNDVAATIQRLPPAPRVPYFEEPRGSLEAIPTLSQAPPAPAPAPAAPIARSERTRRWLIAAIALVSLAIAVGGAIAFFR